MDVPHYAEYSIAKYHMTKENFYGNPPENGKYDLLEVVMVYLGEEKGLEKGLVAAVSAVAMFTSDIKRIHEAVIKSEPYHNITEVQIEEIMKEIIRK